MARPLPVSRSAPPATPLGFWQKAVYGFGDMIIAIRMTAFQYYLLPLYTDVVMLPPLLAGVGKMLGFLWDGVNDPVSGYLSDRTRSRLGRRRPFLLGTAVPLGIAFGCLWSPPPSLGTRAGFVFMVLALMIYDTFYSLYSTPYMALGAELSRDYHERTKISASRSFFHVVGLLLGGVVPGAVLAGYPDAPATGFAVAGVGLGAFMIVVALTTGAFIREVPPPEALKRRSLGAFVDGLRVTLRNRPFRILISTFAFILLAGGLSQTLVPYAFTYWLGMPSATSKVILVYLTASVLSLPLWTRLAGRFGKDVALKLCMAWATLVLLSLPFALAPGMGRPRLVAFLLLAGLGNGGWAVLPVAITADIVDHDELDTDERREGAYFGVWTLVMKLSTALSSGIVGLALQLLGYVPNQPQTATTIFGIRMLYGPVPAACMVAALVLFWHFPLTRERHRAVQEALAARRRE
ncbi:MAG TPA: glycoside-pentoside-hexuronide (GPH):cation symporter [Candidatus Binatia bacterium]|nr:glycoside-pentoside-hexuronide (GPH):cation symporter [Candidatus Binatia bacterium]